MLLAVFLLLVGAVTIGGGMFMSLRRFGIDEARTEARLQAPGAHAITCVIPAGQDPVILRAALARAGFVAASEGRSAERLLVECEPQEWTRVKEIVDHAHPVGLAGAEVQLGHGRVEHTAGGPGS